MALIIPKDADIFRYGGEGQPFWVIYSVGQTQFAYKVPADQAGSFDMSNMPLYERPAGQSPDDQTPEWPDAIKAGDATELADVAAGFGTFSQFYSYTVKAYLGSNPAQDDPEVQKVLAQLIARPNMGQTELQNLLRGTTWWKSRTEQQLKWNELSPAEQNQRVAEVAAQLADDWLQNVGAPISSTDATVQHFARQVASGQMGRGAVMESWIRKEAARNPESPWSRTLRNERENQLQRGVDTENSASALRRLAGKWGVQLTESSYNDWAARIVGKEASDADYENYLKAQAKILYPWKDENVATEDAAQPWLAAYSRILEKGQTDLMNPIIQQALQTGTALFEFEKQLKSRPEWLETGNAREELNTKVGDIGRRMGF